MARLRSQCEFIRDVAGSAGPALRVGRECVRLHCSSPQASSHSSISTLFVPTTTSLVIHAAINEGLRSGRGVLLLSGGNARRTTLARNFLTQLDVIKSIIAAGGVDKLLQAHQATDEEDNKARKPVLLKTMEAATLASVKRLRLRQISLVTWMAMRLQKDNNWGEGTLEASRSASIASISTTSDGRSIASVVEAEEGAPWSSLRPLTCPRQH